MDTRMGISIPLYSVYARSEKNSKLRPRDVLGGMTPDRQAEYDFVLRNLLSLDIRAKILDAGCSSSAFSSKIKFSRNRCEIIGIDLITEANSLGFPLIIMDAMNIGFKDRSFDQVICLSAMEHIGLANDDDVGANYKNLNHRINGDALAMKEIWRVLKDKGTLILSVPYGRLIIKQQGYRVYNKKSLSILTTMFFALKKEYYCLRKGKWTKCNELEANNSTLLEYSGQKFHSDIIACLLLEKL
jgi:SAM-dependent methyltransferase